MLGRLLVEQRLVGAEQVEECLAEIARGAEGAPRLGELLVRRGYLTPAAYASTLSGSRPSGAAPELPPEVAKAGPSERFGRYVRIDRLGAGGMGEVWRAYDTDLHRWVALKFLKADDPDDLARFEREAQVAARLSHANIAAVYEVGEAQGRHFIAMQLVRGRTLKAYAQRPVREVVELVRDAARAVAAANAQGVVHRDLKPDNIMVEESPRRVYVMDFGLARHVQGAAHSASGLLIGTPSYMSPEQARGQRADERADVYSLGATLYDLLANRVPFDGTSVIDILMRVVHEEPRPLRALAPRVDRDVETIVMKCLEKERERRYAGAADFADELDRWLAGEPISARPASLAYRWRKRLAKRKALVAVSAVAILVAGVLLGLAIAARRGEATAEREALDQLRRTTQVSLKAALAMRRVGRLDDMGTHAEETRAACVAASARFPRLAEPHYLWGRMLRAQLRVDEAMREQDAALAKDPSYEPSRYERGILRYHVYLAALDRGKLAWARRMAPAVARPAEVRLWTDDELEDDVSREWKRKFQEDLRGLSHPLARALLDPSDRAAEAEARSLLEKAAEAEEVWQFLATRAQQRGELDEAERLLTEALAGDLGYLPYLEKRAEVRYVRAVRLMHSGGDPTASFEGAVADMEEVLRRQPGRTLLFVRRGQVRMNLGLCHERRGGDPSEAYAAALRDAGGAIAADPREWEAYLLRGTTLMNLSAFDYTRGRDAADRLREAIEAFDEAARLMPLTDEPLMWRGAARGNLGLAFASRGEDPVSHYRDAVEDFDAALKTFAARAETWMRRGNTRVNWGNWEASRGGDPAPHWKQAVADYAEAVRLGPLAETHARRAAAQMNWGQFRMARGEDPSELYDGALRDCDRALEMDPQSDEALAMRGNTRVSWGMWQAAQRKDPVELYRAGVEDLQRAAAINPGLDEHWLRLGNARMQWATHEASGGTDPSERLAEAIRDFDRGVKLNPKRDELWVKRADAKGVLVWWLLNRPTIDRERTRPVYESAYHDYTEGIRLNPTSAEARARRGYLLYIAGVWKEALADFAEATRLNPAYAPHYAKYMDDCRRRLK